MGNLIDQLALGQKDVLSFFSIWELLVSLALSFALCMMIAYVYRATHKGVSYSQSFVVTMIIVGVTVSVIMLIIGSNIARAFTLVGALSIIRFRNAVKETRDVGFIFLTMAVGMACGTRFYGTALIFTLVMSSMIYLMYALNFFERAAQYRILKVHVPENVDPDTAFNDLFYKHVQSHTLLSMESVRQGVFIELVYSVVLKKGASARELIDAVRVINGNAKVSLTQGETVNI